MRTSTRSSMLISILFLVLVRRFSVTALQASFSADVKRSASRRTSYHLHWRTSSDGWGCALRSAGCPAGTTSCSADRPSSHRPSGSTEGTRTSAGPHSSSPGAASARTAIRFCKVPTQGFHNDSNFVNYRISQELIRRWDSERELLRSVPGSYPNSLK